MKWQRILNESWLNANSVLNKLLSRLKSGGRIDEAELHSEIALQKELRLKSADRYQESPSVSILIQSFNHCGNIPLYVERLNLLPDHELIVCEDGSQDGSLSAWVERLQKPNDFVVRSNDLHEIRAYDRALNLAKGDLICLMQDDEVPPDHANWYHDAVKLFDQNPDLVMLGGYLGFAGIESENHREHGPFPGDLTNLYSAIPADITSCDVNFMFVEAVNIGPIFIRKNSLLELGGFDFKYAPVGWPGIHFDVELSLRVWSNGGQVGWYNPGFSQLGARGTEDFGHKDKRLMQLEKNHKSLVSDYGDLMPKIQQRVRDANASLQKSGP